MALVKINPRDDSLDRLIDRRVLENNVRRLPAKLQREAFFRPGDRARQHLADRGRAGKRELIHVRVIHQHLPGRARTGHDVNHAIGQTGLLENLRQMHRRDAGCFGWLQNTSVPGRERRGQFPGRHHKRKIPRDDLPGHA
jgi:hypothetical protein